MKSILENRSALAKEVDKVAEVVDTCGRKDGLNVMAVISPLISQNL